MPVLPDSQIVRISTDYELGKGKEPTLPSLLWPGTPEAVERHCTCPVEENVKRQLVGIAPVLRKDCRVHNKICQAEPCACQINPVNPEGNHLNLHVRCDHCTNVLHICVICEAVYLDDGDDPSLWGWKLVENDPIVKGWRCRRCK